ncbi:MAG: hypothetical protein KDG50_04220 [Chromatiales bacterium]|nr:hypothetical protein [Chromatiales bacterium]
MSRAHGWLPWAGLATLCVIGLIFWWTTNFRYGSHWDYEWPTAEALRNPWLAAERTLHRLDVDAHSDTGPGATFDLPPPTATLVLRIDARTPDATAGALLEWAGRGGHLIAEPAPDMDYGPFYDELGAWAGEPDEGVSGRHALTVDPGDAGPPLRVQFDPWRVLHDESGRADWATGGDEGLHLLQYHYGEGRITLVSDLDMLTNARIGEHDHAQWLYRLATYDGREGGVWLRHRSLSPGLWAWLVIHAWPVFVALAVWLWLWLWRALPRFGPVRAAQSLARRSLLEHLDASARLDWRLGFGADLLARYRDALHARLRQRHPAWLKLDPDRRAARLAAASGLPADVVSGALAVVAPANAAEMTERARTLQTLRNAL